MTRTMLILIFFINCCILQAQSDLERVAKALDHQIAGNQKMENNILMEMNHIDNQLESQLDTVLERLTKTRDSVETGSMIISNKKKIIRDLQKAQAEYKKTRIAIEREFLTNNKFIRESLKHLLTFMDIKINERIEKITKVTDSLNHYQEYYDWNRRHNDRKNVRTADKEKDRVIKAFEKEILELKSQAKKLNDGFNKYETKKKIIDNYTQLQTIHVRTNLLEHSIEDIINGGKNGNKVGRIAGLRLDKEIRKTTAEINGHAKNFIYSIEAYKRILKKRQLLETKSNALN